MVALAADGVTIGAEAMGLRSIDTFSPPTGAQNTLGPADDLSIISSADEITFSQTENQRRKIVGKTGYDDPTSDCAESS